MKARRETADPTAGAQTLDRAMAGGMRRGDRKVTEFPGHPCRKKAHEEGHPTQTEHRGSKEVEARGEDTRLETTQEDLDPNSPFGMYFLSF